MSPAFFSLGLCCMFHAPLYTCSLSAWGTCHLRSYIVYELLTELPENPIGLSPLTHASTCLTTTTAAINTSSSSNCGSSSSSSTSVFASIFAPSTTVTAVSQSKQQQQQQQTSSPSFPNLISALPRSDCSTAQLPSVSAIEPTSLSLSTSLYLSSNGSSLFQATDNHQDHHGRYAPSAQPAAMSATALLQKAAQIGAAASNASLLRGFGLTTSSPSSGQDSTATQWNMNVQPKPESGGGSVAAAGLGLGLASAGNSGLTELMMGPPMTRDLLGLSIGGGGGGGGGNSGGGGGGGGASTGGLSALLNSFGGGGFDITAAAAAAASYGGGGGVSAPRQTWDGPSERKSNGPALL